MGLGWASVASEGKGWRTPFPCKQGERSELLCILRGVLSFLFYRGWWG
jgi:hypothetical protein